MCLATIVKTNKGPVHQQCVMELYGIVDFLDTNKQKSIYWCPRCKKVTGDVLTPEQMFKKWGKKGLKFTVEVFPTN